VLFPHYEPNGAWLIIRLVKQDKTGKIAHHFEVPEDEKIVFDGFGTNFTCCPRKLAESGGDNEIANDDTELLRTFRT
jgi:hypothetical protein